jgi:alpha-galactosidase
MYDFAWSRERRGRQVRRLREVVAAGTPRAAAAEFGSERAEELVAGLLGRQDLHDEALNLPNHGAVSNLPDAAIVETPARVTGGVLAVEPCGSLPEPVAELCRRQVTIAELGVAGLLGQDRSLLLQALALDPMVDDPRLPGVLLDECFREFGRYLG